MKLLKKENWLVNLILMILSEGFYAFILGHYLKVYKKDAWYRNKFYWIFGTLLFFFPVLIMFSIFNIQIMCSISKKLEVPGSEIYCSPYVWILCLILQVIGWSLFIIMLIYILIWPSVMIYRGNAEQYID
ncbi:MAG: hypothetical protein ACK5HP_00245 [Bacilli bacterium]